MKTFWVLEPSPYKTDRSINAIIYKNVRQAQQHKDRPLTRNEIANLIKKMKDKGLFQTKRDRWGLFNSFMANMRQNKLVQEEKPA